MIDRIQFWWWKRKRYNCPTCQKILLRGKKCGRYKTEGQKFPDGGWVQWRSYTPCSKEAPSGIHPRKPLLDEPGDLDDVMSEVTATIV